MMVLINYPEFSGEYSSSDVSGSSLEGETVATRAKFIRDPHFIPT